MKLNLDLSEDETESVDETLPVPVPARLKDEIRALQKKCGKKVWRKTREFLEQLVQENKDKIEKAG